MVLGFAGIAYGAFLAAAAWSVAFLANVDGPTSVDGPVHRSAGAAVVIDLVLLGLFAVHHSVMARAGAKRWIERVIPASAERSTYVLVASLLLVLALWQWEPLEGDVWHVGGEPGRTMLWLGYAAGWVLAVGSTFMIDHLDLFGFRQARAHGGTYVPPTFTERWLYAWVRHPLMLGFLIAFWCTPDMSKGHLLFAAASTAYIAVGVRLEQHALERELGAPYREYAARVPAVIPRPRRHEQELR